MTRGKLHNSNKIAAPFQEQLFTLSHPDSIPVKLRMNHHTDFSNASLNEFGTPLGPRTAKIPYSVFSTSKVN